MDLDNKYGTLEIQKNLLVLLKEFDLFAKKNDITYSLDWGSLLGAIRHKGFIPWDDDLDIMVDRANYNKLLKAIFSYKDLDYDHTSPETIWIGRVHLRDFGQGTTALPTLDVFILDNAPDSILARKLRLMLVLCMQGMMKVSLNYRKGNLVMRLASIFTFYLGKLFSREHKLKWYDKLAQKSNKQQTSHLTCYYEEFSCLGKYYPSDLLDHVVYVPFETIQVSVVQNYHNCLQVQFGDNYMTPPAEIDRKPKHI